jgi:zinc transport system substrate-binding protein
MIVSMKKSTTRVLALVSALSLTLAACGGGTSESGGADEGKRSVVTSFYPLQLAAERIGGDLVTVSTLTKPGAEPHDVELGAQDLAGLLDADLVVYSAGFQPAVDDGIEQAGAEHVLEVSKAARLDLEPAADEHAGESAEEHAEHSGADPHFWLDPQRYADVAEAIGDRLATDDPANAAAYEKNTATFVAELEALDKELSAGLASCSIKTLVTSHAAFAYLADRYGFEQHGISGLSPEVEPSAAGLKEVSEIVKAEGVTTIYQETLVEPHFARTVATATGASLATLDPLEGINDQSAGTDYFEVMRSNLKTLQQGQECS